MPVLEILAYAGYPFFYACLGVVASLVGGAFSTSNSETKQSWHVRRADVYKCCSFNLGTDFVALSTAVQVIWVSDQDKRNIVNDYEAILLMCQDSGVLQPVRCDG